MERPLVNMYKFWNFDNRFLVGVGFKFLKLRCMLHVLLKHLINKLKRGVQEKFYGKIIGEYV